MSVGESPSYTLAPKSKSVWALVGMRPVALKLAFGSADIVVESIPDWPVELAIMLSETPVVTPSE